jgi:hypothetical protein
MAGAQTGISPKFKESLPDGCPPPGAGPFHFAGVYRFVSANPATDDDFASYQALEEKAKNAGQRAKGRPRSVPPCVWAATSLFVERDAAYEALPKPRERFEFLAKVTITEQCGVSILKRKHISFWRFESFVPMVNRYEAL